MRVRKDEYIEPFALWGYNDNKTGWGALLGDEIGEDNPPYLAPARMTGKDFDNLPALCIQCGELDILRDEGIEYAAKFRQAGISAECHIWHGCPHGYDA